MGSSPKQKAKAKRAAQAAASPMKGAKERVHARAATAKDAAKAAACIATNCEEPRYRRVRWCSLHNRCAVNMKSQAEENDAVEEFDKAMSRDDSARAAMDEWEKVNPVSAKWKRKNLLDWLVFKKVHTVRKVKGTMAAKKR